MASLGSAARRLKRMAGRGGRAVPRLWLFGDPQRLPDPRGAAARLPRGAGVVARGQRGAVLRGLARLARGGLLLLLVGGAGRAALGCRAGLHVADRVAVAGLLPFLLARRRGAPWAWLSVAVHGRRGVARARRLRPDVAFVSPLFVTASHAGEPALGPHRWARLARALVCPAVALGGVTARAARRLPRRAAGVAAIGALAEPAIQRG